jgi:cyanate permease
VRRRGLAQGIRFSILSLFQIIALQMTAPMVLASGWRVTTFIWGFIIMAFIPLTLLFIREGRPEQYGMLPDGADVDLSKVENRQDLADLGDEYASRIGETEFTFRQAVRTMPFWALIVALGLHTLITGGFTIHVIPFLTDRGLDTSVATYMMGMMVFFAIPARFFGGIIADRLAVNRLGFLLSGALCLHVIGIGSFLLFRNTPSMYVLLICYGFSMGAGTPMLILMLGRFFGRKAYGAILGTSLAIFAPLGLISPVYCGWVYDTYGNYDAVFVTFIIAAAVASLVSLTVRPPKKPAPDNIINY